VRFKQIAAVAKTAGIGGFEWMDGIPGTVGGGLRMNAGAMGIETFDQVLHVRTMDHDGRIYERTGSELDVGYRHANGLDREVALGALLKGDFEAEATIVRRLEETFQKRKTTQPAAASAGCIFRNPVDGSAGKVIDDLGLKNFAVGAARVSDVHGNFIVNDGGASSADVLELIRQIQEKTVRERGLLLEPEVRIVGQEIVSF
jgi:UDP-N-acetylenolpyruvoylglucosamine reductase